VGDPLNSSYLLLQCIGIPVLASVFIFLTRYRLGRAAGWIAGGSLIYTTILLCLAGIKVYQGHKIYEEYLLIEPGIRLGLLADGLSLPVAWVMNLLCAVLALFSIHYVEHRIEIIYGEINEKRWLSYYSRYFYIYLLFPVGFVGIALASNIIAMYFFLELLTIILYFLMAYFGYIERIKVALMCLLWGFFSAVFFLAGSLLIYSQMGSFEISQLSSLAGNRWTIWIGSLIIVGLLAKLAIVPFHVWMPWVHAEHPTCIAGLLAIYANIAAYIIVRLFILPLRLDFQVFGLPLMVMALITMIYGSFLTLAQHDIKRIAACSTISQIAYSILGLGALTSASIQGGLFFFLSHIMGKTIFFSTAGIVVYVTGIRDMREMGGLARKMPLTAFLWIISAMMLSGFPPFSSFAAEWIMFTGIFERGLLNPTVMIIAIVGVLAILLTVCYTFSAVKNVFFGPLKQHLSDDRIKDPPLTMSVPLLFLAAVSVIMGMYPKIVLDFFHLVLGKI
jgi:formate hydrogenlyase subunit 3/multisubunit Na+/H+ antiporter MnhD subunit